MNRYINILLEDLQPITEDNPIIVCQDSTGKEQTLNLWCYAAYFLEHIQDKHITKKSIFLDSIRLDRFIQKINRANFVPNLAKFIGDTNGIALQEEMRNRHGTHINWCALYALCVYIQEIIQSRLFLKLKPSLSEIIEQIGSTENIQEINISLSDNTSQRITNPKLFATIISALRTCDLNTCEIDSIVPISQVFTKEYTQIIFVDYLSRFFHDYFKIKRRSNAYITATEQKIICYLLYKFGFCNYIVTASRYRQLFSSKSLTSTHWFNISPILRIVNSDIDIDYYIPLGILTHTEWKDGRINPLQNRNNMSRNNVNVQVCFPSTFEGCDLIITPIIELYNKLYSK